MANHAPSLANVGNLLWFLEPGRIEDYLADFPHTLQLAIRRLLAGRRPVWLMESSTALTQFRLHPEQSLQQIKSTFENLSATVGARTVHVVCRFDNPRGHGLDEVEVEAVLAPWMAIEFLQQLGTGTPQSRTLAVGRLRDEHLGVCFRLESLEGPAYSLTLRNLDALHALPRCSLLFLGSEQAAYLLARPTNPLAFRLRQLISAGKLRLGLWVPRQRTADALANLHCELAPIQNLAPLWDDLPVRFEDSTALSDPERFESALSAAGLMIDCSLAAPRVANEASYGCYTGPYVMGGAYQPQPFDLRIPSGVWRSTRRLQVVPLDLTYFEGDWQALAAWRQRFHLKKLSKLLDFFRMESYFRQFNQSLQLQQEYHHFRIYNWPPADQVERCTLVDAGSLSRLSTLTEVLAGVRSLVRRPGSRWHWHGIAKFFKLAHEEARQRPTSSQESHLTLQVKAHGYLKAIPQNTPLRQDVEDFIAFLPAHLGETVELGSGYCQLAKALVDRTTRYCCVDLDPQMFQYLPADANFESVVADVHELPFADCRFDTVLANNLLEHCYDPLKCLKEVRRILRLGGSLYALIPLDGLNPDHCLRTHLWKADLLSIRTCLQYAGLTPERLEIIDLSKLGVQGSFPTCNGLVCKLQAQKKH